MSNQPFGFGRIFIVGLALFSMFFGSGNLVFPLDVGAESGSQVWIGSLGFLLTAVVLPFMGVLTVVAYQGSYERFFGVFGARLGAVFTGILLLCWIPFGSAPRCLTLAHASLESYFPDLSLPLFAVIYSVVVAILSLDKGWILDLLGGVLTPALLLSLGALFAVGYFKSGDVLVGAGQPDLVFYNGLVEGYYTMDLVASFFFAANILGLLASSSGEISRRELRCLLKGGIVGMTVLALVYLGLTWVASQFAQELAGVPKAALLPSLSRLLFGNQLAIIMAIVVSLSCLTTSVALVSVFTEYLHRDIFKYRLNRPLCLFSTLFLIGGLSMVGFDKIAAASGAIFEVIYPVLIVFMVAAVLKRLYTRLYI